MFHIFIVGFLSYFSFLTAAVLVFYLLSIFSFLLCLLFCTKTTRQIPSIYKPTVLGNKPDSESDSDVHKGQKDAEKQCEFPHSCS